MKERTAPVLGAVTFPVAAAMISVVPLINSGLLFFPFLLA